MDITQEKTDNLNAVLTVKIEKEDYESRVEEVLRDYRRKTRMDGFRPGKVPAGLIRKMYGKSVLLKEINKILSESISGYLIDNKINILGDPLPREDETPDIDWVNDTEYEFRFDLGLAPSVDVNPGKKDRVPFYSIQVDDKMIAGTRASYARRFGSYEQVEFIRGNEILKGDFIQVDTSGEVVENGIDTRDSSFAMVDVRDNTVKTRLTGRKAGESVVIDVKKAFPNDIELASLLRIEKTMVSEINPHFRFDIREVSIFREAEINQELFDRAFGEGQVKSEEEFTRRIIRDIEANLERESEYRLAFDIREHFLRKHSFELPVEFLKKWLKATNKNELTDEQLEQEFHVFEKDLKWQLIGDELMKKHDLRITEQEIRETARNYARMQFLQYYGMTEIPEKQLDNYTAGLLKREEEKNRITDRLKQEKIISRVRELITLDKKKISADKFNRLYEKNS